MAIVYLLLDHDDLFVGEHTAESRLSVGEEIVHEDRRYLVVALPPQAGARFIDPLFDGYALEASENRSHVP